MPTHKRKTNELRNSSRRAGWQAALLFGVIVLTVYYFIPRMGELKDALQAAQNISPWWLVAAVLAAGLSYLMAAIVMIGSVRLPLSLRTTLVVQLAATAVNRITPKGIGSIALAEQYLESAGLRRVQAIAAVSLIYIAGFVTHLALLGIALYTIGTHDLSVASLSNPQVISLGLLTIVLTMGLAAIPRFNKFIRRVVKEAWHALRETFSKPQRMLQLIGGSIGITLAYVAALYCTLRGVDADVTLSTVFVVYMAGSAVAAAAPTPSGLGATEAALVVGLSATGVPTGVAIAGVLVFRLLTFWLPIIPAVFALRHVTKHHLA